MSNVPVTVGVPERTPAVVSVTPAGSAPVVTAYVTVPTPPACVSVTGPYAVPAVALERLAGLTVITGQSTTSVSARVPVHPLASVAVTVKLNVPVTVGVPERTPAVVRVIPAGSAPAVTAYVTVPTPPVCVNVTGPYATPAVPFERLAGLTVMTGHSTTSV